MPYHDCLYADEYDRLIGFGDLQGWYYELSLLYIEIVCNKTTIQEDILQESNFISLYYDELLSMTLGIPGFLQ
jgi:hypothetical protein